MMQNIKWLIAATIALSLCACATQGSKHKHSERDAKIVSFSSLAFKESPHQFDVVDIDVHLVAQWQDPYVSSDVALDLEITTPSGEQKLLPGYYLNGKSQAPSHWKVKIAPHEPGLYKVRAKLTDNNVVVYGEYKNLTVTPSPKKGFIRNYDGWSFVYDNGDLFRSIGQNFGWEARHNDDSRYFKALHEDKRFSYDEMIPKLRASGANTIRTWMIYWNLPVDWKNTANSERYTNTTDRFNQSGIARLDQMLEIAQAQDMKVILSLDSHAGFIGEGWALNNYNTANGGPVSDPAAFFTDSSAKQLYKDKLRYVVARWSYSSAILAWEFFNEIDNIIYSGPEHTAIVSDEAVVQWQNEVGEYLKAIDFHEHITTTSISHRDVKGLFELPSIDLSQTHLYKVTDRIPEIISEKNAAYAQPYFVGEYSAEWDWSVNFDEISDTMITDFKRGLWYGLFAETPILPLTWWWEYFDKHDVSRYMRHVEVINRLMLAGGNLQRYPTPAVAEGIYTAAVANTDKAFIYLLNKTDQAQSVNLSQFVPAKRDYQIFDGDSGVYLSDHDRQNLTLNAQGNYIVIFSKN
ncbi:cellulase family glycosylhydrolase [Marinagarivorans algicola]|uniref:cellulase family glycosylhydrolase n=1 Tax=Marinagarivorans algicola TaxID=1513270 RepID=UPI0006B60B6B|nr:cellulase family glycosylhydrolase [Marinagarivorans algicola]